MGLFLVAIADNRCILDKRGWNVNVLHDEVGYRGRDGSGGKGLGCVGGEWAIDGIARGILY